MPSRRPRCSTPMRIHAGNWRLANAAGGVGALVGGPGVCAAAAVLMRRARTLEEQARLKSMCSSQSNSSATEITRPFSTRSNDLFSAYRDPPLRRRKKSHVNVHEPQDSNYFVHRSFADAVVKHTA